MKQLIIQTSNALDALIFRIATIALVLLVAVVLLQVVARYLFFQPPVWTEEAARYLMIWAGLMGATLSFKRGFDPTLARPEKSNGPQVTARVVQTIAVLVFVLPALFFTVFGPGGRVSRGYLMHHVRTQAETLDIATIYVAAAVPISMLVILLHLAARWANRVG